ncbi:MAG: hypothetical protein EOP45_11075 [Sphingobacteriaceae bacterium]|nr:MAG: hypothetical protein EOP45_11075 [Sphingobacteriaceae bacterium]
MNRWNTINIADQAANYGKVLNLTNFANATHKKVLWGHQAFAGAKFYNQGTFMLDRQVFIVPQNP